MFSDIVHSFETKVHLILPLRKMHTQKFVREKIEKQRLKDIYFQLKNKTIFSNQVTGHLQDVKHLGFMDMDTWQKPQHLLKGCMLK